MFLRASMCIAPTVVAEGKKLHPRCAGQLRFLQQVTVHMSARLVLLIQILKFMDGVKKLPSMQCACVILSSVTCPAVLYCSTLSHQRHDFILKKSLNINCVFLFSLPLWSEAFLIIRLIQRDTVITYIGLHVKYPFFLSDFNATCISSTEFRKTVKYQIS